MYERGALVRATAGRDKGNVLCVLSREGDYLLLADGKRRRVAAPKRKKLAHVEPAGPFDHPALQKLREQTAVSDRELRRALAAFKEGNTLGER